MREEFMRIAQLQTHIYPDKKKNIGELEQYLKQIQDENPDFVTLGEMFNCPYSTANFRKYAEVEGGETWNELSRLADKYNIYLSAGSVPESDEKGKIYNTAYVFDRNGNQVGKHRKMHLFDINISKGQYFKESDVLSAGRECTVFESEFGKIGLCICFDMRFPELSRQMVIEGAKVILAPAAFNMTTGPAHWNIMFQSRALDNQCYIVGTSGARNMSSSYIAWGHSLIVSPWGDIIREMDESEGYMINDIDLEYIDKVRKELPLLSARREDIYRLWR
jgi:omega-amidase